MRANHLCAASSRSGDRCRRVWRAVGRRIHYAGSASHRAADAPAYPSYVIVKMGSKGAYWTDGFTREFAAAYVVEAVDTVAAGDAFNGGLAVALAEARPLAEATRWGLAADALAVTRAGAQAAMPTRDELLALLARQS